MDNKYYEHEMKRVDYPAVASAKRLCFFVIAAALALHFLSTKVPWLQTFGNSSAGWITAGIVATIVVVVAIRAIKQSR